MVELYEFERFMSKSSFIQPSYPYVFEAIADLEDNWTEASNTNLLY